MIKGFDKRGQPLGAIDFIETQWNRKWSSCGDFTVFLAAKNYDPNIKYVTNVNRPETGIVQKVEYEMRDEGNFITMSGFFIQKLADFGSYKYAWSVAESQSVQTAISNYLTATLSKHDVLGFDGLTNMWDWSIDASSTFPSGVSANIERGTPSGETLYSLLSGTDYSYYCTPIFAPVETDETANPIIGLNFIFKQGNDYTNTVLFGEAYNNVSNVKYLIDESAEKPFYKVLQAVPSLSGWTSVDGTSTEKVDGETINRIEVWYFYDNNRPADIGLSYPHKVYEAQINGVDLVVANQTEIIAQMKQQAQLDMLSNYKVETLSVDVLQNRFLYLTDYNLGDKCTVFIDELQQLYHARIEEVHEVHADNKVDIEIILGTPVKQKWRKFQI